ncbi:LPS-assembly protein LptD [Ceratobasidium theobromae]|uniref:LPS-assembly protein LptD n=1 Tax=Ceratobasidium theobromae TaxID=1582974 RepID=A0A5N5QEB1_9AGAM|nr:LPS-assembly protein LptD [Ceratobasidium theobromae]
MRYYKFVTIPDLQNIIPTPTSAAKIMTADVEGGVSLAYNKTSQTRSWLIHSLHTNMRVILSTAVVSTFLFFVVLYTADAPQAALHLISTDPSTLVLNGSWPTSCSPAGWSDGTWQQKPSSIHALEYFLSLYPYNASDPDAKSKTYTPRPEVVRHPFAPLGFSGCASGRERDVHLGMQDDGTPARNYPGMWEYIVRGASYEWVPRSPECKRYNKQVEVKDFVRSLVERGGWLLIGGESTFSDTATVRSKISTFGKIQSQSNTFSACPVYYILTSELPQTMRRRAGVPVTGRKTYIASIFLLSAYMHTHITFDIRLSAVNPSSPLVSQLRLPPGFDISRTPLVSFRRVDLLFEKHELDAIHRSMHHNGSSVPELIGPNAWATWDLSPSVYIKQFTAPLPEANYRALVVSTAGHWTTSTLNGARDPNDPSTGPTNPLMLKIFSEAVRVWTRQVSEALSAPSTSRSGVRNSERQVLVRAYLPGHEGDCHKASGPVEEIQEYTEEIHNWSWIGRMNEAFKVAIKNQGNSQIKYLGLDRIGRLRPDAHAVTDCLHIQIGAGIFEGWSRYIWHFDQDLRRLGK